MASDCGTHCPAAWVTRQGDSVVHQESVADTALLLLRLLQVHLMRSDRAEEDSHPQNGNSEIKERSQEMKARLGGEVFPGWG